MNLQQKMNISSEDIYEDLCVKIEKLEYMPGQGISENELCKHYGVSRHMVRGAFSKLKQRRLIEVYPQKGTFVSLIDKEYISDILFLRESIEQEALQRVVQLDRVDTLCEKLEESIQQQKLCIKGNEYSDDFYARDTEFHRYIINEIGREKVLKLVEDPYIHIRRWRNFEIRSIERMHQLISEHEAIVEAIRAKNPARAREAMHIHLDTVGRYGKSLEAVDLQYFIV
jgi:DNA-binding GntR family transcriptional regulator